MKLRKILANPCKYIEICLEHDLKTIDLNKDLVNSLLKGLKILHTPHRMAFNKNEQWTE